MPIANLEITPTKVATAPPLASQATGEHREPAACDGCCQFLFVQLAGKRAAKVSERRYAQTKHSTLRLGCGYNAGVPTRPSCQENSTLPEPLPNLSRRWTVIASGLLLSALALVMLYTGRSAFRSPLAIVVIAAIGLAAALLQLRLRVPGTQTVGPPIWLNVLGLLCALIALFSDFLHLSPVPTLIAALGAVGCFAVSSFLLFEHLRKKRG